VRPRFKTVAMFRNAAAATPCTNYTTRLGSERVCHEIPAAYMRGVDNPCVTLRACRLLRMHACLPFLKGAFL